jgi:hypothetical protein
MLPDHPQGMIVLPHRNEQSNDAQLAEIDGKGTVSLRVYLRIDPLRSQVLAKQLRLEIGCGAVHLCPPFYDYHSGVVRAQSRPPFRPTALLAQRLSANYAAIMGGPIGM